MSKGFKRLLFTCAVLTAVFGAIAGTLHSQRFHRHVLAVLRTATGWNISLRESKFSVLRGRAYLEGVRVENASGTISASADRVRFDVSALSIIRGKIIVTDFEVTHPEIAIIKTGLPKKQLPTDILQRIFARYEKSLLLQSLFLEDAKITDVHLSITDPFTGTVKSGEIGKALISAHSTLLNQLRAEIDLQDTSDFFPKARSILLHATLGRRGLDVDTLRLDAEKVTLEVTAKLLGDLVRGSLEASGSLVLPTVLSDKLDFNVDATFKDRSAEIKTIKASLGKATFDGAGKAEFLDPGDLRKIKYDLPFEAKNLPLESIFGKLPSPILGPAKGVGNVKGRAQGELPDLKAKADATISDFHHGAMHARQVQGTLDFHWPELDWDADIKPGGSGRTEGHVKGGVAFTYLPPFKSVKAMLKSVDLFFSDGTLADILPTANVTGHLKGELHLRGAGRSTSAEGPGHAEVTNGHWFLGPVDSFVTDMVFKPGGLIIFTKTEFRAPNIEPILWPDALNLDTKEGLVTYSGRPMPGLFVEGTYETKADVFKIDTLKYQRNGSDLTGSLVMRDGGGTEAKLKGTANLESLTSIPALFRGVRGPANLDLSLTGSSQNPQIHGWIDFRKNEVELRGFPSIENLEGRLTLEGPLVKPNLTGFLGDGRFQLGGNLTLNQFKPERFDLTLKGSDLSYSKPNAYRIDFDTDVRLSGAMPAPKLSGRVDIVDARYVKPFGLRELVLKPFEDESEPDGWDKNLEDLELDLAIKHSGDLRIKNNIADIFLLADLHVDGTYGRPLIRGAFTATEGEIRLFGDTFTLTEGRLEYIDPAKKEPYLTLTAEEDLPPLYTVFVQLKGYLSNLDVNLSSTPSLPREDVLSLITTGHTQEELRQSGINRQSLGVGVLAGEITSALEQPIAKSTGLDVFRLEASESGQLSKVAVGKNVTDRLTLEFQSDFAPETAQRTLQANYYLTDNILLKGTRVWQSGQSGTTPRYNLNMSFRLRLY